MKHYIVFSPKRGLSSPVHMAAPDEIFLSKVAPSAHFEILELIAFIELVCSYEHRGIVTDPGEKIVTFIDLVGNDAPNSVFLSQLETRSLSFRRFYLRQWKEDKERRWKTLHEALGVPETEATLTLR